MLEEEPKPHFAQRSYLQNLEGSDWASNGPQAPVSDFEGTVGDYAKDIVEGTVLGLFEGVEAVTNFAGSLTSAVTPFEGWNTTGGFGMDQHLIVDTTVGKLAGGISQFLLPFGVVGKGLGLAGKGLTAYSKGKGTISAFLGIRKAAGATGKVATGIQQWSTGTKALDASKGLISKSVMGVGAIGPRTALQLANSNKWMTSAKGLMTVKYLSANAAKSGMADMLAWDENEERFLDLFKDTPAGDVFEKLGVTYDETDNWFESRMKHAIDGLVPGFLLDSVGVAWKARKAYKATLLETGDEAKAAVAGNDAGLQARQEIADAADADSRLKDAAELDDPEFELQLEPAAGRRTEADEAWVAPNTADPVAALRDAEGTATKPVEAPWGGDWRETGDGAAAVVVGKQQTLKLIDDVVEDIAEHANTLDFNVLDDFGDADDFLKAYQDTMKRTDLPENPRDRGAVIPSDMDRRDANLRSIMNSDVGRRTLVRTLETRFRTDGVFDRLSRDQLSDNILTMLERRTDMSSQGAVEVLQGVAGATEGVLKQVHATLVANEHLATLHSDSVVKRLKRMEAEEFGVEEANALLQDIKQFQALQNDITGSRSQIGSMLASYGDTKSTRQFDATYTGGDACRIL